MEYFWLLLAIPALIAGAAKIWLGHAISFLEFSVQTLLVCGVVFGVYQTGIYSQMSAHEIWNGQINSKHRVHDQYTESYECFCSTDSKGNRSCSTCYRKHYTVDWFLKTSMGRVSIKHLDRESKQVYSTPNPSIYEHAYVGEGASRSNRYDNYVRASSDSLFNQDRKDAQKYIEEGKIPKYPQIYGKYKVNHVMSVGPDIPNIKEWNKEVANILRGLGAAKQVNFMIVFTDVTSKNYADALEAAWRGANKNDAVLVISTQDNKTIDWVRVFSWSKNQLFNVELRDKMLAEKSINIERMIPLANNIILEHFERREMTEFKYLKDAIHPPTWVMILALFLSVGLSVGLTYVFFCIDLNEMVKQFFNGLIRR